MSDDKRTKIGPTGPVRETGAIAVPAVTPAPASSPPIAAASDAPSQPPGQPPGTSSPAAQTSYLPPAVDPLLGQTLAGRYQISRKLGEGGMGAVYLATHNLLEKQVALKVLHGEFARKPDLVERFMQEAKAASRIRHENVIDISDFGSTPEGLVFFAMELLKGHDLHEEVSRARLAGQLLPWERSKRIFLQICAALAAAHRHGIIHRDLKPENVYLVEFLGDPDFVKLLDFGIAKLTEANEGERKLTRTGMLFGTPEYMSPEQARGEPHVDHRVDIYAMGCILFQLVTGRVPFEADNFMGVLSLHLTEPAPSIPVEVFDRIGAPRELAHVIDKALEKDRNQRWQSIDDFANAVRVVCGEPPVAPGVTTTLPAQSVPAPAQTKTQRASTPPPGTPTAVTQNGTGRVKTQWTGSLAVPAAEVEPAKRSKLPLILGAVLLLGGGGAAAVFALGGKGGPSEPAPSPGSAGSGDGSATTPIATAAPADAAPVEPPAPDAPAAAPLPASVSLRLDSVPPRAEIRDLMLDKVLGRTPMTLTVEPSHEIRRYTLTLKGYGDALIELRPNQATMEHVARLEKGVAGAPVRHGGTSPGPGAGSGAGSGSATAPRQTPDAGSGTPASKPPDVPKHQPSPDDDCPELPCLKTMPAPAPAAE
ncbi:MAG: serine/threonine-protein kinase [Kofleriaceae bacterium]